MCELGAERWDSEAALQVPDRRPRTPAGRRGRPGARGPTGRPFPTGLEPRRSLSRWKRSLQGYPPPAPALQRGAGGGSGVHLGARGLGLTRGGFRKKGGSRVKEVQTGQTITSWQTSAPVGLSGATRLTDLQIPNTGAGYEVLPWSSFTEHAAKVASAIRYVETAGLPRGAHLQPRKEEQRSEACLEQGGMERGSTETAGYSPAA